MGDISILSVLPPSFYPLHYDGFRQTLVVSVEKLAKVCTNIQSVNKPLTGAEKEGASSRSRVTMVRRNLLQLTCCCKSSQSRQVDAQGQAGHKSRKDSMHQHPWPFTCVVELCQKNVKIICFMRNVFPAPVKYSCYESFDTGALLIVSLPAEHESSMFVARRKRSSQGSRFIFSTLLTKRYKEGKKRKER